MTTLRNVALSLVATLLPGSVASAQSGISSTKHNLSVSGPGPFKAQSETRICIFCHAPHRASLQTPLWNRNDTTTTYLTYTSSTFQGTIGQPNGSTKLCLSCHDGTIALGKVVSMATEIPMVTGRRFLDSGSGYLGANLRDDHPVSFHYATSRGGSGIDYKLPSNITAPVRLDANGFVQCTSCHDAHDNIHGRFLRQPELRSAICFSCHEPRDWNTAQHNLSSATWNNVGSDPWPYAQYGNVRDNACANCHRSHAAGQPERLLNFAVEEENCLRCHNGNVASKNIQTDLAKAYRHPVTTISGAHDPTENPLTMARHSECVDCHSPHTARSGSVAAPGVPGSLFGVSGIDGSGGVVARVNFGYEVCYKCHADNNGGTSVVSRIIQQTNVRLEFDPTSPSHHAVEAPGRNPDVPSLLPPWTTGSILTCWDCHNSNSSPTFGGGGSNANGPHGSMWRPILGAKFNTTDYTQESSAEYALCYKCHSRSSILNDVSFEEHKKHIEGEDTPCSVCHDPHGVSASQGNPINNSHLINFDRTAVFPSQKIPGVLRFEDRGRFAGSCTLLCHDKDHDDKDYGPGG